MVSFSVLTSLVCAAFIAPALGVSLPDLIPRDNKKFIKLDFDVKKHDHLLKRDSSVPEPIANKGYWYSIDVTVGSDKQPISVCLDTGSSDLWVPLNTADCYWGDCTNLGSYNPSTSSSSKNLTTPAYLGYGIGYASGYWFTDLVGLTKAELVELPDFQFVAANASNQLFGILGIGYPQGEGAKQKYPNFVSVLKEQGYINKRAYSIYLNNWEAASGTALFGAKDTAKYLGDLVTLPVTVESRLAVDLVSIGNENGNASANNIPSVLDTGTTRTELDISILGPLAEAQGWTAIDESRYTGPCDGPDVVFDFGLGAKIAVPYKDLVLPQQRGQPATSTCVLTLENQIWLPNEKLNIIGDNVMQSMYAVYDLEDNTISIAQAKYTTDSNIVPF